MKWNNVSGVGRGPTFQTSSVSFHLPRFLALIKNLGSVDRVGMRDCCGLCGLWGSICAVPTTDRRGRNIHVPILSVALGGLVSRFEIAPSFTFSIPQCTMRQNGTAFPPD